MKRRISHQKTTCLEHFEERKLRHLAVFYRNILSVIVCCLAIASCSSNLAPTSSLNQPPSQKIRHHIVSRGETLYSIAWRYGWDFKELASVNHIRAPYSIYPGQRLKLYGQPVAVVKTTPRRSSGTTRTVQKKTPKVAVRPAVKPVAKPARKTSISARNKNDINWRWPVRGPLLARFSPNDPLRKGVDIGGEKGESVQAAADGTVIYAGSALRGYGKLLIIKHSEEFLSAYAHNHKLLVGEGTSVKAGQRIAELGSSGTDRNMLHFEIRRNGKPVDPMAYLP